MWRITWRRESDERRIQRDGIEKIKIGLFDDGRDGRGYFGGGLDVGG